MAAFEDVYEELGMLSKLMSTGLAGREVIEPITVPKPSGMKDELYFHKLVSWSYVALTEAFPVPLKQLSNSLRSTDIERHKLLVDTRAVVQALRTVQSHNLAKKTAGNERQRALTETWYAANGGAPLMWEACCTALCAQVLEVLRALRMTWEYLTTDPGDRSSFLEKLCVALDTDWPAHTFDPAVEEAARSLGLVDFDVVAFRQSRLEEWRKLVVFFPDRQAAIGAMNRAITQELKMIFGLK